jgi:hypothetical protein
MCIFKLVKLTRMTYIFDYLSNQISNQVEQKWTILVKMANGFQSNGAFSQIGQNKMTCLVKMT